jgi:hypothetical protein
MEFRVLIDHLESAALIDNHHVVMITGPVQAAKVAELSPVFHWLYFGCGRAATAPIRTLQADTGP